MTRPSHHKKHNQSHQKRHQTASTITNLSSPFRQIWQYRRHRRFSILRATMLYQGLEVFESSPSLKG